MPAAVLVLAVLGSIAVDSAVAFLGQHRLNDYTTSAADSAAAAAIAPEPYYQSNQIVIDEQKAQDIAAALEPQIGSGIHDVKVTVTTTGDQVVVTAEGTVGDLFAVAIPGLQHSWRVRSTSTARARRLATP